MGQKISRGDFHHWPDGQYAYWQHARDSEHHQAIRRRDSINMKRLLDHLPTALAQGRAYQKLMRDPNMKRLRSLFQ